MNLESQPIPESNENPNPERFSLNATKTTDDVLMFIEQNTEYSEEKKEAFVESVLKAKNSSRETGELEFQIDILKKELPSDIAERLFEIWRDEGGKPTIH